MGIARLKTAGIGATVGTGICGLSLWFKACTRFKSGRDRYVDNGSLGLMWDWRLFLVDFPVPWQARRLRKWQCFDYTQEVSGFCRKEGRQKNGQVKH